MLNSVTLAEELKYWDNSAVYIAGGKMRMHGMTSLVDSFATAFIKACDAIRFDTLITDWDAAKDELSKIEDAAVQVIVVDKE